jgi:hypothetical protein
MFRRTLVSVVILVTPDQNVAILLPIVIVVGAIFLLSQKSLHLHPILLARHHVRAGAHVVLRLVAHMARKVALAPILAALVIPNRSHVTPEIALLAQFLLGPLTQQILARVPMLFKQVIAEQHKLFQARKSAFQLAHFPILQLLPPSIILSLEH